MKLPGHVKKIIRKPFGNRLTLVITISAFGLIGSYLLYRTFAATPFLSVQPESGTLSGAIAAGSDGSGTEFVVFGTTNASFNDDQAGYGGTWAVSNDAGKYNGDDHYSQTTDSTATFSFSGTSVTLYGAQASHHGIAGVSIDNQAETLVDYFSSTRADNVALYQSPGLSAGSHTIKIRVTGTKNVGSTGVVVTVDRFVVGQNTGANPPPPPPTPPPTPPPGNFHVGYTLTQDSVDVRNPSLWSTMANTFKTNKWYMNAHVHGFGIYSPTLDNYASLDARINRIRAAGAVPVITLCCATGAQSGTGNDWDFAAPSPANYDAYATMSAQVAARYPDVTYFQVWNEMKGFWNAGLNRWDYEGYTAFYNKVYTKVKAVRPDAQLGGPYVVPYAWASINNGGKPSGLTGNWGEIDGRDLDVITYWLANKVGGEFITIDMNTGHRDGTNAVPADDFAANDRFAAVSSWIHQRSNLPIWWGEFYPRSSSDLNHHKDVVMDAVTKVKNANTNVVLLWQEECNSTNSNGSPNAWNCSGSFNPLFNALKAAGYY